MSVWVGEHDRYVLLIRGVRPIPWPGLVERSDDSCDYPKLELPVHSRFTPNDAVLAVWLLLRYGVAVIALRQLVRSTSAAHHDESRRVAELARATSGRTVFFFNVVWLAPLVASAVIFIVAEQYGASPLWPNLGIPLLVMIGSPVWTLFVGRWFLKRHVRAHS